jgi:hypothetical protein
MPSSFASSFVFESFHLIAEPCRHVPKQLCHLL